MTSSTRPRNSSHLADSVQHQLNKYAVAAGAAGVGVLAFGQSAAAKIVYTPADESITADHAIPLDLTHDGTIDFRFTDKYMKSQTYGFDHTGILSIVPVNPANNIQGYSRFHRHYASALRAGDSIGPNAKFTPGAEVMATAFIDTGKLGAVTSACNGPWSTTASRYLGLKFLIDGEVHFGWARLKVGCENTRVRALLSGYAYETVANQPIIAGKTGGPMDAAKEESSAGAKHALTAAQPISLGVLALGSQGVPMWRREEFDAAPR